jgi:hypothetical protein
MEYWSIGVMEKAKITDSLVPRFLPVFHYSSIPLFHEGSKNRLSPKD